MSSYKRLGCTLSKKNKDKDEKLSGKALLEFAKKAGKKLVVDPVSGKILMPAKIKAVDAYCKQLAKNNRLCVECGREPMVKPGYVHAGCARAVMERSQPKTIAEIDSFAGRYYADTWGYGLMSALGCGCDILGPHTCEQYLNKYSWDIKE